MGTKDPRIDAYIEKSAAFAKPILKHIRKLVHKGCPDTVETMKWSHPQFEYKGVFCGMAAFKWHCTFGFWKWQLIEGLDKATGEVADEAAGQFGCITDVKDLPSDRVFLDLIKKGAKLNDDGIKVPKKPKPKSSKPIVVPPDFLAALRKNRKILAVFEDFSPSHKREYIEWITEAKTEETRQRRLVQAIEWIAEGKSRNWKYMRK